MEKSKVVGSRFFSNDSTIRTKPSMKKRYQYYRQQNAHQQFDQDFKRKFQHDFPNFATWLKLQQQVPQTNQINTLSHWLIIGSFALITVASFTHQLLFLFVLLMIAALIKGPGMILWGVLYSFLVSLFPPLGLLLSALFFLLTIRQLTKNMTFVLSALYFYTFPFVVTALHHFTTWNDQWLFYGGIGVALISGHLILKQNYRFASSRGVAWALITVPYDCIMALVPKKHKGRLFKFSKVK
ncbi:hypothetical protein [Enterococcus sp. DIV0876]|uniref:hypothetical protein n=1 Tax=Enterococcus sp. DIV0876 TaxID=2774633 RepID=UPI003D2FEDFE